MDDSARTRPWPTIERADDVAAVVAGLESLPVRTQLITGTAGIGKTVLGRQVAERFADRRIISVVGLAELSAVPLGAFAPAIVELGLPTDPQQSVPALLAQLGRDPQGHLLVVDDAPRLDDLSAAALYQLVRGFGLPAVLTARLGERLPRPIARLIDEGFVDEHALGGLGVTDVDHLLEERFGARTRHADIVRLTTRTEGNPLYLRVLLESAAREGGVRRGSGFVEISEGSTPPGLLATLAERISALPLAERRLLRVVALTQPIERDSLAGGRSDHERVDALLLVGLLVREPGSRRLRIAHPLVAEALEQDPETAPAVEQAIALLLATGGPAQRFAAIRLQLATSDRPAVADLVWAAERARATGDVRTAVDLAETALAEAEDPGLRFRASLTIASAHSVAGELDLADAAFAAAQAHVTSFDELALLAGRRGEHLAFRRFDVEAAIDQAQRALADRPADGTLDADLRLWRALLGQAHVSGGAGRAAAQSELESAVRSAMAAIMTDSMGGRSAAAGAAAATLASVQERLGVLDPVAAALLGFDVYIDRLSRGAHEAAVELAESRRVDAGDGVGFWTCAVAHHRNYNGRLAEAHRLASLAVDQCRWRDVMGVLGLATAIHADTTAKLGDADGARRILATLDPAQRGEPKVAMMIAECEAWLAQAAGDRERAAAIVVRAAESAVGVEFRLVAAISLGLCIRLGVVEHAAAMLEQVCAEVPADFGLYTALRDLAVALRDRRPEHVPNAAARLTAAGMAPTALDGVAIARRMRTDTETRHRLDVVAAIAAAHVDAPLLQARTASLLSPRELQVAAAAAGRERSREIAGRLGVSVRTVDNQLQSIYRKLGVGSRDALRSALMETGLPLPQWDPASAR